MLITEEALHLSRCFDRLTCSSPIVNTNCVFNDGCAERTEKQRQKNGHARLTAAGVQYGHDLRSNWTIEVSPDPLHQLHSRH